MGKKHNPKLRQGARWQSGYKKIPGYPYKVDTKGYIRRMLGRGRLGGALRPFKKSYEKGVSGTSNEGGVNRLRKRVKLYKPGVGTRSGGKRRNINVARAVAMAHRGVNVEEEVHHIGSVTNDNLRNLRVMSKSSHDAKHRAKKRMAYRNERRKPVPTGRLRRDTAGNEFIKEQRLKKMGHEIRRGNPRH